MYVNLDAHTVTAQESVNYGEEASMQDPVCDTGVYMPVNDGMKKLYCSNRQSKPLDDVVTSDVTGCLKTLKSVTDAAVSHCNTQ